MSNILLTVLIMVNGAHTFFRGNKTIHRASAPVSSGLTLTEMPSPSIEGAEKQTEMNYVASCLGETIHPTEGFSSFTTGGVYRCWLYCKATSQCTALTFDTFNGRCSLLEKENYDDMKLKKPVRVRHHYLLRECMKTANEEDPGKNLTEIKALSQSGIGFLIQKNYWANETACLTKLDGANFTTFPVKWVSCKKGSRWLVTQMKYSDRELGDLSYYQISLASWPDLCLDVDHGGDQASIPIFVATVTECRKITLQMTDTQVMSIFGKVGTYVIHSTKVNSIFHSDGERLDMISTILLKFKDPGLYQGAGKSVCKLAQFSTDHGALRNRENVTFYLPGDVVEVQCDPGYGVRKLNFSSLQTITCSRTARPRSCERLILEEIESKEKDKPAIQHVVLIIAIISATSTVVSLVNLLAYQAQSRKDHTSGEVMDNKTDNIEGERGGGEKRGE